MGWCFVGGGEGGREGNGCVVDVEVLVVKKGGSVEKEMGEKVVRASKKEQGEIDWGEWLRMGEELVEQGIGMGEMLRMGSVIYGGGWVKDM